MRYLRLRLPRYHFCGHCSHVRSGVGDIRRAQSRYFRVVGIGDNGVIDTVEHIRLLKHLLG